MEETTGTPSLRWGKALANGLLAWVIGFALYMIPSFVVAFKMGFELGPQGVESSVISKQIGETVSAMYRDTIWLGIGYTVVIALLVFWRARVVARGTGASSVKHGLLVAVVPVLLSLVSLVVVHADLSTVLDIVIFCAAGYIGGRTAKTALP
jgi:hypothetical protein